MHATKKSDDEKVASFEPRGSCFFEMRPCTSIRGSVRSYVHPLAFKQNRQKQRFELGLSLTFRLCTYHLRACYFFGFIDFLLRLFLLLPTLDPFNTGEISSFELREKSKNLPRSNL